MKKIFVRILLVVVVLLVAAVVAVSLFLDRGIKKGIETVGPRLTQVSIKVDDVGLSLLSGSGEIKGLEVGNPEGYSAPTAIKIGEASMAISPGSLLSDKVVIKHIRVHSPELTIEGTPNKNNLTKIRENVEAATGGGAATEPAPEGGPAKKLQVNEFVLADTKVNYVPPGFGGRSFPIVIPSIRLTDLGTGPEGITAGDLTRRVLSELTAELAPILAEKLANLGKEALGTTNGAAGDAIDKATRGVTDLFKKK